MKGNWVVSVKGYVNGFSTAVFAMEKDAIKYFKDIRRSLDSSKFIMTRESLIDKDNPENVVCITTSTAGLGLPADSIERAKIAANFNNEPYIKLLDEAMQIVEQNGYSIVKRSNEYLVNIYYKVVYLGLAEVTIMSSDIYFDEDSIIIEKESAEVLAFKIIEMINRGER